MNNEQHIVHSGQARFCFGYFGSYLGSVAFFFLDVTRGSRVALLSSGLIWLEYTQHGEQVIFLATK